MPRSLVSIGSNLGDCSQHVAEAIAQLQAHRRTSTVVGSALHETRPIGGPSGQNSFVNAAVSFDTDLAPQELHAVLQQIEQALGRTREVRSGARTLDLDLLLYDAATINTPSLVVPHPRMAYRRFVLAPAAEIGADMMHPVLQWTVGELLARLNQVASYVAILGLAGRDMSSFARELAQCSGGEFLADPAGFLSDSIGDDSAGPEFQTPIEFLDARAAVFAKACWPPHAGLVVSDFYLDQTLAYARAGVGAQRSDEVVDRWHSLGGEHVEPKLLVVFVPPLETLAAGSRDRRLVEEFLSLASRPRTTAAVIVDSRDPNAALVEITAAIEAMQ